MSIKIFFIWLLKNGIKIDGSYVSSQVFDEALMAMTRYNDDENSSSTMTRDDAIMDGINFSNKSKQINEQAFRMNLDNITSGRYQAEYNKLAKQDKAKTSRS